MDPTTTDDFVETVRKTAAARRGRPDVRLFIEPTGSEGSGILVVGLTDGYIREHEALVYGSMRA